MIGTSGDGKSGTLAPSIAANNERFPPTRMPAEDPRTTVCGVF